MNTAFLVIKWKQGADNVEAIRGTLQKAVEFCDANFPYGGTERGRVHIEEVDLDGAQHQFAEAVYPNAVAMYSLNGSKIR